MLGIGSGQPRGWTYQHYVLAYELEFANKQPHRLKPDNMTKHTNPMARPQAAAAQPSKARA